MRAPMMTLATVRFCKKTSALSDIEIPCSRQMSIRRDADVSMSNPPLGGLDVRGLASEAIESGKSGEERREASAAGFVGALRVAERLQPAARV